MRRKPSAPRILAAKLEAPPAAVSQTPDETCYVLRLFIQGSRRFSAHAVENLRRFCEEHLAGRHRLEIVDLAMHPHLAREHQVIAAPLLLKTLPLPLRRLIGDMSRTDRILKALDLKTRPVAVGAAIGNVPV